MDEEDNKLGKEVGKKSASMAKEILKLIGLKKWLMIIGIVLLIIVLISGLAWAEEIITFADTSKAVRNGGNIKVKNENGEEVELEVKDINDLVEIKGNSQDGYYIEVNYLDEYLDQILSKEKISYSDLAINSQKDLLKKMIMAEFTTQYPDVTYGYDTANDENTNLEENRIKGTIHVKRISEEDINTTNTNEENNSSVSGGLENYTVIGDSYTVGLNDTYHLLNGAHVHAKVGVVPQYWIDHFSEINEESPKGIVVELGINNSSQTNEMKKLLDKLHEKYPDVKINVLKVFHIGSKYTIADKTTFNSGVDSFNSNIESYCKEKNYNFIDATEGLIDSSGYLNPCTEDGIHISGTEANSKFYNNILIGMGNISDTGENSVVKENIDPNGNDAKDLIYINYDELKNKIKEANEGKINYKDVLKYYTLDEQKIIVAKWESVNGNISLSESFKSNYLNVVGKYTTPFEYLLAFLLDGQDEKFISDFIDLILNSKITITVMDQTTDTTTTVKTQVQTVGKFTPNGQNVSQDYNQTVSQGDETNNEKYDIPKIQVTYVNSWFVEVYAKYNFEENITGPSSQGTETTSEQVNKNIQYNTQSGNLVGTETTIKETFVKIIQKNFKTGISEAKDNTDKICEIFKKSEAKGYILDNPTWLLEDLLDKNEKTVEMVKLTKYWLQKATGRDFGVDEFDFGIYKFSSFSSAYVELEGVPGQIFNFVLSKGASPVAAAAIVGNIEGESSFNPSVINEIGATGLCQWMGNRLNALKALAESEGKDWTDVDAQMEFMWNELETSYTSVLDVIMESTEEEQLEYAVWYWGRYFEVFFVGDNFQSTKGNTAKRYTYALKWYSAYQNCSGGGSIQLGGITTEEERSKLNDQLTNMLNTVVHASGTYSQQGGPFPSFWTSPINTLTPFQCTWWAYGRASQYLFQKGSKYKQYPKASDGRCGNGGEWFDRNKNNGWFKYGSTPKPNSIVSWSGGSYGHVAYVEGVSSDGIFISEAGGGSYWGGVRKIPLSGKYGSKSLNGYIYLDEEN